MPTTDFTPQDIESTTKSEIAAKQKAQRDAAAAKIAVAGEAVTDMTLSVASVAAIVKSSESTVLGVLSSVFSVIGVAMVGTLWFAGKRELQQIRNEIKKLNEGNEALELILGNLNRDSLLPINAKQQVLELLVKESSEKAAVDNLSAAAAAGSEGVTTVDFAAQPLEFMTVLSWVIWPIAAVFGAIAAGFAWYRSRQYKKLQNTVAKLEEEKQGLLTQLETGAGLHPMSLNDVKCDAGSANEKILQVSLLKDKVPTGIVATTFGAIAAAVAYAILKTVAAGFILACPPLALIAGVIAVTAIVGAGCYKAVMGKIKATAVSDACKIKRMCKISVVDEPKVGFSASTTIRFIGAVLGVLALVTIPIVGWAIALGVGIGLSALSFYCTRRISKTDVARKEVVAYAAEKVRDKRVLQLEEIRSSKKDVEKQSIVADQPEPKLAPYLGEKISSSGHLEQAGMFRHPSVDDTQKTTAQPETSKIREDLQVGGDGDGDGEGEGEGRGKPEKPAS